MQPFFYDLLIDLFSLPVLLNLKKFKKNNAGILCRTGTTEMEKFVIELSVRSIKEGY
jgi:hypothetical protein